MVVNLLATLLVYREVTQLRERPDVPAHPAAAPAPRPEGPQLRADAAAASPGQDNGNAPADTADAADDLAGIRNRFETQYDDTAWTAQVQQALQEVAGASVHYAGGRGVQSADLQAGIGLHRSRRERVSRCARGSERLFDGGRLSGA